LKSAEFKLPVISVGNLSAGGTGKTPHVEYLIRLLKDRYKISVVSRGYLRKTKGFVLADIDSTVAQVGDEPMQYINKFENILVAVDENRKHGIQTLLEKQVGLQAVILDDAYQHRYVKPGLSILLTDFHSLYSNDYLLPAGRLREPVKGANRADIIIVTKTDPVFSPLSKRAVLEKLKPLPHQKVFFSYVTYGQPVSLYGDLPDLNFNEINTVVLFAGIANPYPLEQYLKRLCSELVVVYFKDHHQFSDNDINTIISTYNDQFSKRKVLITTEKDAMRLHESSLKQMLKEIPIYYIPIEISFHFKEKGKFDKLITDFVETV
ncbi:MAG: tetraacyldisaccharide 4'-kinase, partial [Bacteroidota bacterium]|nr:tetraacyldisaccharide 4'-kinase [Bacteroidota bacterium]